MKPNTHFLKRLIYILILGLFMLNTVAFFHAYKFTHFADSKLEKTKNPEDLSFSDKINALVFGISNPRPFNKVFPSGEYETLKLQSNYEIEAWHMKTAHPKGTIVLFHGFSGEKSSMLDKSDVFLELGYNTFLVDFMGSGNSAGNRTTVGFLEAWQVKSCYEYLRGQDEENIYLFGTSMGAVAILKALNDHALSPSAIILECPFGTMYETVQARFNTMKVPSFPMAGLLVFWGGAQHGFWAFGHNPEFYAKKVNCPVLLMHGEKDEKVSRQEIDRIFENLRGDKVLKTYPLAGHENYLDKYKEAWQNDVKKFLLSVNN